MRIAEMYQSNFTLLGQPDPKHRTHTPSTIYCSNAAPRCTTTHISEATKEDITQAITLSATFTSLPKCGDLLKQGARATINLTETWSPDSRIVRTLSPAERLPPINAV